MDPMRALDMETRSGIAPSEIDDFAERMDLISQAMEDIKNGTFDPATCKVPGYKTPEQEEAERLEKRKRDEERQRREHERKRQLKHDERESWWMKAKLRFSTDNDSGNEDDSGSNQRERADKVQFAANRALAAYKERDANDYSAWRKWEPRDPATLEEAAEREAALEQQRNREFEASNPEFCDQFKQDQAARHKSQREKERVAEKCKQQGNVCYRRKQYEAAIAHYMKALDASPFHVAVLTNVAQSYLRLQQLDDSVEFSTRALFIAPDHVKALSRRAAARHIQRHYEDAAADMARAMRLEPTNEDLVEQHSIIVGDFEDSVAQQQLHATLANTTAVTGSAEEHARVQELRFVVELLKRMEEIDSHAGGNQAKEEEDSNSSDPHDQSLGALPSGSSEKSAAKPSWIAYELLLPLLERNESVRTLFRTSSELRKLCDRIVAVATPESLTQSQSQEDPSSSHDHELVVNAMISCAAAAMTNCSRNQIVMYQHASFRKHMLAVLTCIGRTQPQSIADAKDSDATRSEPKPALPWTTQASVLRFFEEAVELKSWKRLVLSTCAALRVLLKLLAPASGQQSTGGSKCEQLARQSLALSASSICVTLSSDEHGIRELVLEPSECAQALAKALDTWERADPRAVSNLLGVLTNLSTADTFRAAVDAGARDSSAVQRLAPTLLSIAHGCVTSVADGKTRDVAAAERALAALLNLSFHANAQLRQDLAACNAVRTLESLLRAMTPATYELLALTLSRAVSLLCRLHAVVSPTTTTPTLAASSSTSSSGGVPTDKGSETALQQLTHRDLLDELYRVCLQALSTASSSSSSGTANSETKRKTGMPSETWQLCAQIWCHVGWCVHAPAVRAYLREKRAVYAVFETIRLANAQPGGYRSPSSLASLPSSSSHDTRGARERLVGNAVKVLITMQGERDPQDAALLAKPTNLAALVDALQLLPDGLARKNVAILLAKLCQADAAVKDEVRKLRGIEMMLAVSQSLQQQQSVKSAKSAVGTRTRRAAPGAAF